MTKEEIENLQIGDVYEFLLDFDNNGPRTIVEISDSFVYYRNPKEIGSNEKSTLKSNCYKLIKKANMENFDIKPGMVLITSEDRKPEDLWIAFTGHNKLCAACYSGFRWNPIDTDKMTICEKKILYVTENPRGTLDSGTILWSRQDPKEMTVAEIEEKLGLKPGSLRIKK